MTAIRVEPHHQNFLDEHFGVSPQWMDFHKKLKDKTFVSAVQADTRSDDKLKAFANVIGMREQAKGKAVKVPSDITGSYNVKYHPQADRFSCTCADWTYKQSLGGGDCKHIDRLKTNTKENLMKVKKASMGSVEAIFRVGRTINRESRDKNTTQKLRAENQELNTRYPRPSFISEYMKHASEFQQLPPLVKEGSVKQFQEGVEMAKKMAQAARRLRAA